MKQTVLEFERFLKKFLQKRFSTKSYGQKLLRESIFYSLLAPASRFRPRLCFAVSRLLGQEAEHIFPWAGALEMIHCASLIHDDLPAMDNAKVRRKRACNHLKFGEDLAILAGDCLFVESFSMLIHPPSHPSSHSLFQKKQTELIQLLVSKIGFQGLMGGQALDLRKDSTDNEKDRAKKLPKELPKELSKKQTKKLSKGSQKNRAQKNHLRLRRLKTGSLIEASGLGPLLLWGKETAETEAIKNFCFHLGIAYQIADDLKDFETDQQTEREKSGKQTNLSGNFPVPSLVPTKKTFSKELKTRLSACKKALLPLGDKRGKELENLSLSLLP